MELVEVAHHLIAAELVGGVRVDCEAPECFLTADLLPPAPGPRKEEPLGAGQTINYRRLLAVEAQEIGPVTDRQTTKIADVLAQGQAAVHRVSLCFSGGQLVVLVNQLLGEGVERGAVLIGPPIIQPAAAVELGALVIETMTDFMTDHRTDRPIVHRRISVDVEERRLQDGRRKGDLIHGGHVIRVDGLWGHQPVSPVNRATQFRELAIQLKRRGALHVAVGVAVDNVQRRIVNPRVGEPDLGVELAKFRERPRFRGRGHPVEGTDTAVVGGQ